jgi:hypothetical protein
MQDAPAMSMERLESARAKASPTEKGQPERHVISEHVAQPAPQARGLTTSPLIKRLRHERILGALAALFIVCLVPLAAICEWRARPIHSRAATGDGQVASGAGFALRTYTLSGERLFDARQGLRADLVAPRVGSQVTALRPVEGSISLAPAGDYITSQAPAFSDTAPEAWLHCILKPDEARRTIVPRSGLPALVPALPTPIACRPNEESGLPPQRAPRLRPPRSWDPAGYAPAVGQTVEEGIITSVIANDPSLGAQEEALSADDPPTATDISDSEPAAPTFVESSDEPEQPAEDKASKREKARASLSEEVYAAGVHRPLRPIGEVSTSVAMPRGQFDPDVPDQDERPRLPRAHELFAREGTQLHGEGGIRFRPWPEQVSLWDAPGIATHPLYFEEVYVERYGYSFGLAQPVVSAAHFFGRIPALPYLMTVDPPLRCVYTLGHYRAGSCAPLAHDVPPFDPLAAAVQGGVVTGLVFLIP